MQTMAVKKFGDPAPSAVSSDSSSDDEDRGMSCHAKKNESVKSRPTKSLNVDEEKVLRALLKKWMARVS